jgi:hypothetical protein
MFRRNTSPVESGLLARQSSASKVVTSVIRPESRPWARGPYTSTPISYSRAYGRDAVLAHAQRVQLDPPRDQRDPRPHQRRGVLALLARTRRAEQVHPPRVVEEQRARGLADQLGGLGDELRVGDLDVGDTGRYGVVL